MSNATVTPAQPQGAQAGVPTNHREESGTWLDGYLKGIIGISVFGGQITFTVLVSEIADPAETARPGAATDGEGFTPTFRKETVRTFIGISWLLFTVSLGISVFLKMVLSDRKGRDWLVLKLGGRGSFDRLYSAVTLLLNILSVARRFSSCLWRQRLTSPRWDGSVPHSFLCLPFSLGSPGWLWTEELPRRRRMR